MIIIASNWDYPRYVHVYTLNSATGNRPSLPNLLKFPSKHGNINIAEQIGEKYKTFGTLLLKDKSGTIVSAIEHEWMRDAEKINGVILEKWICGKGLEPFTWDTLVKCLKDADLNVLAKDIEDVLWLIRISIRLD